MPSHISRPLLDRVRSGFCLGTLAMLTDTTSLSACSLASEQMMTLAWAASFHKVAASSSR